MVNFLVRFRALVAVFIIIPAVLLVLYSLLHESTILVRDDEPIVASTVASEAQRLVDSCANESYRPYCYEQKIPKLLSVYSIDDTFELIREIKKIDSEYLFCHVLAHNIGNKVVAEDPNNWLTALANGPQDGLCSNGYAHGAILARFNQDIFTLEELENIQIELAQACDTGSSDLYRAMCYHGLGHVLVHMTNADVFLALEFCQRIAVKQNGQSFQRVCNEGVYMQLFQPLEPEDHALINELKIKPETDNLLDFCRFYSHSAEEFNTCWRESWPLISGGIQSVSAIHEHCSKATDAIAEDLCYTTMLTIVGRRNLGDHKKTHEICSNMDNRANACYAIAANAHLEEDWQLAPEAIQICTNSLNPDTANYCLEFLAQTASFNYGVNSEPYNSLCAKLEAQGFVCQVQ